MSNKIRHCGAAVYLQPHVFCLCPPPTPMQSFTYTISGEFFGAQTNISGRGGKKTTGGEHVANYWYYSLSREETVMIVSLCGERSAMCKNERGQDSILLPLDDLPLLSEYSIAAARATTPTTTLATTPATMPSQLPGVFMHTDPEVVLQKLFDLFHCRSRPVEFYISALEVDYFSSTGWSIAEVKSIFEPQKEAKCGLHVLNHVLRDKIEGQITSKITVDNLAQSYDAIFSVGDSEVEEQATKKQRCWEAGLDRGGGNDMPHAQMENTLRMVCNERGILLDGAKFQANPTLDLVKTSLFVVMNISNWHWIALRKLRIDNFGPCYVLFESRGKVLITPAGDVMSL